MKITTRIGELLEDGFPSLDLLEHYFIDYNEDEWSYGGQSSGRLAIYGAEGSESADPFKDRIDVKLSIYDDPAFGMYLHYSKTGGGYREHFFSVGDMSRLKESTESRHGTPLSLGLFVSPATAWLAVKDFITGNGARSTQVSWVNGDDLPPEAFPEY